MRAPARCISRQGARRRARFCNSDISEVRRPVHPGPAREAVFGFVRGNTCRKEEIGLKATGNGLLAICNWHLLSDAPEEETPPEMSAPGALSDPQEIIAGLLPLTPGKATGNSLDVLDRRWARGNVLAYLSELPDLMAFNDEAHHIHEFKREGEATEVEWQKSLSCRLPRRRAGASCRWIFGDAVQRRGQRQGQEEALFPAHHHRLRPDDGVRQGLVKSLVLDRRKEIGALPLEFKAERDADGNPTLSDGQRVMLRAGLSKLKKLEAGCRCRSGSPSEDAGGVRRHDGVAAGSAVPA